MMCAARRREQRPFDQTVPHPSKTRFSGPHGCRNPPGRSNRCRRACRPREPSFSTDRISRQSFRRLIARRSASVLVARTRRRARRLCGRAVQGSQQPRRGSIRSPPIRTIPGIGRALLAGLRGRSGRRGCDARFGSRCATTMSAPSISTSARPIRASAPGRATTPTARRRCASRSRSRRRARRRRGMPEPRGMNGVRRHWMPVAGHSAARPACPTEQCNASPSDENQ